METRLQKSLPQCSICLQLCIEQGCLNCCTHKFCLQCIYDWSMRQNSCPVCKKKFKTILPVRLLKHYKQQKISKQKYNIKKGYKRIPGQISGDIIHVQQKNQTSHRYNDSSVLSQLPQMTAQIVHELTNSIVMVGSGIREHFPSIPEQYLTQIINITQNLMNEQRLL